MILTPIEKEFEGIGRKLGATLLFSLEAAIELIEICRDRGIGIHGMEGFKVYPDGRIQPDQDHSNDLEGKLEGSHDIMLKFLEERRGLEFWYEVYPDQEQEEY